jgi:hypothetical protein
MKNLLKSPITVCGLLLILFLFYSITVKAQTFVLVSGTVSVYQTSTPLPNTIMHSTMNPDKLTDENGYWQFLTTVGNTLTVTAEKEGYRFIPPSITMSNVPVGGLQNQNFSAILSVTDIVNIPTSSTVSIPLNLPYGGSNCIIPSDATFTFPIVWTVSNPNNTGATITYADYQYTLHTEDEGVVILTATIVNGITIGEDFIKDFTINVVKGALVGSVSIVGNPVFGNSLSVNTSSLTSNPNGITPTNLTYEWKRNDVVVGEESTYTITVDDIGKSLNVSVMAENLKGSVTSTTVTPTKVTQTAPPIPTLQSKTKTTITLNVAADCEYQMNGGNWQNSPTFSGLTPNTEYSFVQRKKETETHLASPNSGVLKVKTDEEVGIVDYSTDNLIIYPNPTTNEIRICGDAKPVLIEIFDNIGRKVMTVENNNVVNVSSLSVDTYMVKIHTDIGIRTVKIVKQ